jgi:hypothetical protein
MLAEIRPNDSITDLRPGLILRYSRSSSQYLVDLDKSPCHLFKSMMKTGRRSLYQLSSTPLLYPVKLQTPVPM